MSLNGARQILLNSLEFLPSNSKYGSKLNLPGSYASILGENWGRFGEFFRYLWLSSFQEGKFRIADFCPVCLTI
jgi:hypothetical protein